nr:MAG TPA: hypothetical protein [Caudoviricetes sp.]
MKDNRKRDERSTGTEEPWDTQRISLLRSLFWSANYMAGVAHGKGDLTTTRMALRVVQDTLNVEQMFDNPWKEASNDGLV